MSSQELELGCLVTPDGGTHPGVVMIPDVWGLADHQRDLARRLASEGFCVLAMDLYRRTGRPRIDDPAQAMEWIRSLDDPLVMQTLQECLDFLAGHERVGGHEVGLTGFCLGGQYTVMGACHCSGVSAAVPFYGMLRYPEGLDPAKKPWQPIDMLADLSCPLLGLYGAEDHLIPREDARALEERGRAAGQPCEVVLYDGAGHAFMNDTREAMYRPEAAADAWRRLVAFLRDVLQSTSPAGPVD